MKEDSSMSLTMRTGKKGEMLKTRLDFLRFIFSQVV
jgi:hypothetical protein